MKKIIIAFIVVVFYSCTKEDQTISKEFNYSMVKDVIGKKYTDVQQLHNPEMFDRNYYTNGVFEGASYRVITYKDTNIIRYVTKNDIVNDLYLVMEKQNLHDMVDQFAFLTQKMDKGQKGIYVAFWKYRDSTVYDNSAKFIEVLSGSTSIYYAYSLYKYNDYNIQVYCQQYSTIKCFVLLDMIKRYPYRCFY